jgi:hypothetical protein
MLLRKAKDVRKKKDRRKNRPLLIAARLGLEPRMAEPESAVLPITLSGKTSVSRSRKPSDTVCRVPDFVKAAVNGQN